MAAPAPADRNFSLSTAVSLYPVLVLPPDPQRPVVDLDVALPEWTVQS